MSFNYTDEQLNYLNRGEAVYSVNSDYIKNSSYRISRNRLVTSNTKNKNETNTLTSPDGQEFRVIATKSDPETGFDGLAVALFF